VITVVSDTHGTDGHRLEGRTLTAVREASLVVHAGDFTTGAVLDAFESEARANAPDNRFVAVWGNNDGTDVRRRLGARAVVNHADVRLVVVHGHEHDGTSLSLLGRQEEADLVVVGHSHDPEVDRTGPVTVLNPGSHADPRWYRPAHAELEPDGSDLEGRLVQPDGTVIEEFLTGGTG
jgi:putative phosphoesterase